MKLEFNLDSLREYLVHILIFLVLVVLVWKVLLPQIGEILANRALLVEGNNSLESLNNKVKFLENLDKTSSKQKLQRLNLALPLEKDVGLMLTTFERVAARSNIRLGNLTVLTTPLDSKIGLPTLVVTLNLRGNIDEISRFISEIGKTLPVMQVSTVTLRGDSVVLTLSYYFKEIQKQIQRPDLPPKLSKNQEDIFNKILEREASSLIQLELEGQPTTVGGRPDPFH